MKVIGHLKLAAIALALIATSAPRAALAVDTQTQTGKAKELSAVQSASADAAKYDNIAVQSRMAISRPAPTATDGKPSSAATADAGKTATSSGLQPAVSDSTASAAAQYEKLAVLAEKLAANARKVAEIHAKAAAALQAQAAVTAKLRR
jgi:hypothetical protein